jgi:hypothetical protein
MQQGTNEGAGGSAEGGETPQGPASILTKVLGNWRHAELESGISSTLTANLPKEGYFVLQVLGITLEDERPTGEIVVHDGQYWVRARVASRYIHHLKKRDWGMYSIIQVKATAGPHTALVIVSFPFW